MIKQIVRRNFKKESAVRRESADTHSSVSESVAWKMNRFHVHFLQVEMQRRRSETPPPPQPEPLHSLTESDEANESHVCLFVVLSSFHRTSQTPSTARDAGVHHESTSDGGGVTVNNVRGGTAVMDVCV